MSEEIRVHVVDYNRKCLYMRYRDPITGKHIARSTGIERTATGAKKLANREAAKWESDLREGRYKSPSKITWEEFREQYEEQAVPAMAAQSFGKITAVANSIEHHLSPRRLRDIDAARVTLWQQKLRHAGLSESTIRSYTGTLKAMLNWAHTQGTLPQVPKLSMPKRARKSDSRTPMKGRPITTEEFERMLAKTADVVTEKRAESWQRLLWGLWLSGLRIGEACKLTWDGNELSVDMTGEHPMLRIDADHEKGNRDRILPIAPEFAEFLRATPEAERTGYVFDPIPLRTGPLHAYRASQNAMERVISKIGEKANVKVMEGTYRGQPHTKYASAHDLRRVFGSRWAVRVMPAVLQKLMRHESIETTLRYYVGLGAQETTQILYAAISEGNTSGNNNPNYQSSEPANSRETPEF